MNRGGHYTSCQIHKQQLQFSQASLLCVAMVPPTLKQSPSAAGKYCSILQLMYLSTLFCILIYRCYVIPTRLAELQCIYKKTCLLALTLMMYHLNCRQCQQLSYYITILVKMSTKSLNEMISVSVLINRNATTQLPTQTQLLSSKSY